MAPGAGDVDALMMKQCSFSLSDLMLCVCVYVCVCWWRGDGWRWCKRGEGGWLCVCALCVQVYAIANLFSSSKYFN